MAGARTTKDQQIAELTRTIEVMSGQLAQNLGRVSATNVAMVGIRNISDYVIGIKGAFGTEDIQLFPDVGDNNPRSFTVIPYAFWKSLIKDEHVRRGMLVRDDSILGSAYIVGPEDEANEISQETLDNRIYNPVEWITSKSEDELRSALTRITSNESLRRLRRAVDIKLKEIQKTFGDSLTPDEKVKKSWSQLPMVYHFIEEYTTQRLERPETEV